MALIFLRPGHGTQIATDSDKLLRERRHAL